MESRNEHIHIEAILDKKLSEQYKEDINKHFENIPVLIEGETLTLSWDFYIGYFNDLHKTFEFYTKLLKIPGLVKVSNLQELNDGICAAKEFFKSIEEFYNQTKNE